jgi:hypothetical protein
VLYIFEIECSAGPIPETIKAGQDSYPLQNPLHARKPAFNQLGRKERKPRQVNKKW